MKTPHVRNNRLWCPDCPEEELVRFERLIELEVC